MLIASQTGKQPFKAHHLTRCVSACLALILLVMGIIAPLHRLSHEHGAATGFLVHTSLVATPDAKDSPAQIEAANCSVCDLAAQLQSSDAATPIGLPPLIMVLHTPPTPPSYVVNLCSLTVALRSGRAPPIV